MEEKLFLFSMYAEESRRQGLNEKLEEITPKLEEILTIFDKIKKMEKTERRDLNLRSLLKILTNIKYDYIDSIKLILLNIFFDEIKFQKQSLDALFFQSTNHNDLFELFHQKIKTIFLKGECEIEFFFLTD